MNRDCDGCGKEDCEPTYNEYSNLILCDFCYESADEEEQFWEEENTRYENDIYEMNLDEDYPRRDEDTGDYL